MESNTFKRSVREAVEIQLRKPSLNTDNGFELANTLLFWPLRDPNESHVTLLNIHIYIVQLN